MDAQRLCNGLLIARRAKKTVKFDRAPVRGIFSASIQVNSPRPERSPALGTLNQQACSDRDALFFEDENLRLEQFSKNLQPGARPFGAHVKGRIGRAVR